MRCWLLGTGLVMLAGELLLAGSLLTFQGPRVVMQSVAKQMIAAAPSLGGGAPGSGGGGGVGDLRSQLLNACVLAILYVPMHIFCAVAALTFMVLPPAHAATLWVGGLFIYYSLTGFDQPEHTGRREWPAFQAWMGLQLERFLPAWLGELPCSVLCCAVLCCAVLCCAVPCRAVPCRAVPCHAMPCHATPCREQCAMLEAWDLHPFLHV